MCFLELGATSGNDAGLGQNLSYGKLSAWKNR